MEAILRHLVLSNAAIQFDRPIIDDTTFPSIAAVVMCPPYFTFPKIYISQDFDRKTDLERIAVRFGATLVDSKLATHHVISSPSPASDVTSVHPIEYSKTLGAVFVHFLEKPDSNNAWVSESTLRHLDGSLLTPTPTHTAASASSIAVAPFVLNSQYLLLLESFGEWLREEDFLATTSDSTGDNRPSKTSSLIYLPNSRKRQHEDGVEEKQPADKRVKYSEQEEEEDMKPNHAYSSSSSSSSSYNLRGGTEVANVLSSIRHGLVSSKPSGAFGVLSQPSLQPIDGRCAPGSMTSPLSEWKSSSVGFEPATDPQPSLVLPHHSKWFHMDKIHDIERHALPEFFVDRPVRSSNKSAEIYREYRDFMIHTYQQNPSHYLNYTSCRRSLAGDACAVLRVFDFLESVGLINYAINADVHGVFPSGPSIPPPSDPVRHALRLDNPVMVSTTTSTTSTTTTAVVGLSSSSSSSAPTPLILSEYIRPPSNTSTKPPIDLLGDSLKSNKHKGTTNQQREMCSNCKGSLGMAHFQLISEPSNVICTSCITSLDSTSLKHYRLIDNRSATVREADERPWTDSETLCLLDGLEKFGDDFDKVSEYVQSRDKVSCILQFLRLPIEETFCDNTQSSDRFRRELTSTGATTPAYSSSPNPISSLTAFITRTLSPKVAAAAAKAAVDAYLAEHPSLASHLPAKSLTIATPSPNESSENGMDVDNAESRTQNGRSSHTIQSDRTETNSLELDIIQTAGAALAASVLKATLLAEKEERDARKTVQQLIDAQMKKIELKMKYFDDMERFLEEEHKKLEALRASILEGKWRLEQEKRLRPSSS